MKNLIFLAVVINLNLSADVNIYSDEDHVVDQVNESQKLFAGLSKKKTSEIIIYPTPRPQE